jgi:GT2 family glycosyltransferase
LDVYLIDNGSVDGSVGYVQKNFPWVKIIRHKRNLGFAEGYNRAIEKVEAGYVVVLNSDTQVLNPSWVQRLVDVATKNPKAVAVACKMVSMDDHSRLDSVGGMGIPYWRGFIDIGREEHDRGQYDHEGFEPFAFCGGAALIKRDIFMRLEGFDGRFFLYVEDADLSWRLRLLGYEISFAPDAKVAHYFSGSAGSKAVDDRKLYYCHRNFLRAILKNCGSSLSWALRNYFLFSFIVGIGFSILEPEKAIAIVRAILWNLFNFEDAYTQRLKIQVSRVKDDTEILAKMFPGLNRYQPAQHIVLRRILNILFEHGRCNCTLGRQLTLSSTEVGRFMLPL